MGRVVRITHYKVSNYSESGRGYYLIKMEMKGSHMPCTVGRRVVVV